MKKHTPFLNLVALSVSTALFAACDSGQTISVIENGSGEEEVVSTTTTGIALPSEISAVPIQTSSASSTKASVFNRLSALAAATSDLSNDSDYHSAQTRKYIEERSLQQFDIIEQLLTAINQTNYADSSVINQGPYTAIITWEEEEDGREVKTLQPWVVDSRMIIEDGEDVNRVLAWIEEADEDGGNRILRAEFKVHSAATVAADGTYTDYGNWDLNVAFDEEADSYFVLSADSEDGVTTIQMNEFMQQGDFNHHVKGILSRSASNGYGKVSYPDWESCETHPCAPPTKTTAYSYNADYLATQKEDESLPTYKNREPDSAVELTHRYGIFFANDDADAGISAGDSVERHMAFGFPIKFQNDDGFDQYSYYGAWQGRHEIWGGEDLEAGDTVVRDTHNEENGDSYVISEKFKGTLTKRTLADSALSDIQGIPIEIWINKSYEIKWFSSANSGNGAWKFCDGWIDWQQNPPACMSFETNTAQALTTMTDFNSLVVSEEDRKHVGIYSWDQSLNNGAGDSVEYVYLATENTDVNWSGAGFYTAEQGEHGKLTPVADAPIYIPSDQDHLQINIGGSLYILYTGTENGWVQKQLVSFDQDTWTPTFDDEADSSFTFEMGREYYINNQGSNYIVRRVDDSGTDSTDYEVKTELQSAANPTNITSILPAGTSYLSTPWQPESKYTLGTDASNSTTFMKLIYAADDPNTPDTDEEGTLVTDGQWGLQAFNSSDNPLDGDGNPVTVDGFGIPTGDLNPIQFNWEYSENGWGTQQFLCSPDCSSVSNYLTLADPVRFQPLTTTNHGGDDKTLSLAFDGWMHGMPDLYHQLSKNGFVMSADIADKVVNLEAGTELVNASGSSIRYFLKPLDISMFLEVVTTPASGKSFPDIGLADSANLSTVPDYTDNGMGDVPTDTEILFSEGLPVDTES